MTTLGLRAEANGFYWAISEGTLETPILLGANHVSAPNDYKDPEALGHLRSRLSLIINDYKPEAVGLRTPESISKNTSESARKRLRIEGVILATCAESNCAITMAALQTLNALLGVKSAKALLDSDAYRELDWSKCPVPKREAILIGISLLPHEGYASCS